jgi:polyphosphate kinase
LKVLAIFSLQATLHISERSVLYHVSEAECSSKLASKVYEQELVRLQVELVKMQYWAKHVGTRIVIIFEGRDAAGKGGTIERITEPLDPRGCRVVALGTPSVGEASPLESRKN